jgi:hypothetical protein
LGRHISGVLVPADQAQPHEEQDDNQHPQDDGERVPRAVRCCPDRATSVALAQVAGELVAARMAAHAAATGSPAVGTPPCPCP